MHFDNLQIKHATINDLESIVVILNQAVQLKFTTGFLNEVPVEDRIGWFHDHSQNDYPLFIASINNEVAGWLSVSAYRPGRMAFRFTKEISYYVAEKYYRQGVATGLLRHIITNAHKLNVKTYLAMVQEKNPKSISLLRKFNFQQWGQLPCIADYDDVEGGLLYYGLRVG